MPSLLEQPEREEQAGVAAPAATTRTDITATIVVLALLGVGVAARVYQYAWNRSLFLDEAALALNLRDRSFLELFGHLDHAQFAPIGFLLLQKALVAVFGAGEYVLRAPALAAGIAGLFVFTVLAKRVLPPGVAWAAVGLFAFNRAQIFWSSDVKQYSVDVLVCLLLVLAALDVFRDGPRARWKQLAAVGAVGPYFSSTAVLVMAGLAVALAVKHARDWRALVPLFGVWLLAAPAALHAAFGLSPADRAYFRADWWEGFLPLPLGAEAAALYLRHLRRILYDPLGFAYSPVALVVFVPMVAGALWLLRHRRSALAVIAAPILATYAASLAGVYPIGQLWAYAGRVVLFLAPFAFLLMAAGCAWVRWAVLRGGLLALLVAVTAVPALAGLPYSRGDVRPALQYVKEHAEPDDVVYVYYGLRLPLRYYGAPSTGRLLQGWCSHNDWDRYRAQLDALRAHSRLWVLLGYNFYGEHYAFLDYLQRNAELIDIWIGRDGLAGLYDLTVNTPTQTRNPAVDSVMAGIKGSVIDAGDGRPMTLYPTYDGTVCEGVFRE